MKILLAIFAFVCIVIHVATDNMVASSAALVFALMAYFINEDDSWEVSEYCDYCQHLTTYRDNDNRHPCAQCQSWNRFKIADHIKADLKDKVNEILKVVNHKEELL